MLDISSSENIHFIFFQQWAALHCTSVFISVTSDTWYDAGESQGMSSLWIIIFYFGSSYITLIKRFFVSTVQLKSWGFDICLYEIIEICICYIEKARSCYWMTVTNQLLHGPPHHLCAHLVALCHIVPSQLCWHESQVVMCQNNFDIKVSQFFSIMDSFSSVGLSNNISKTMLRLGKICLSLSATTFHFQLWKDLVLTSFYPSFKTFLRLPSSI